MIGFEVPPELVRAIAEQVADVLLERGALGATTGPTSQPWLGVDEAATYISNKPQRVYDLVHDGVLKPGRDGRRLLFRREDLDAYLLSGQEAA